MTGRLSNNGEEKMRVRLLLLMAAIFILVGCITPAFKKDNPIGKTYRDVFVLENKQVPLPEGEWKVAGTGYRDNQRFCEVYLVKVTEDRKLTGVIIIISENMAFGYSGYLPDKYAKRTDLHYVSIKSNTTEEGLDLWLVNHYFASFSPKEREASNQFFQYCHDNKIDLSKLMIQSYHVITGKMFKGRFLGVTYFYDPRTEGFDTSLENDWGTSSWHPLRISADPKKVSYVERIKKEGEVLHGKIQEWFGR
jgi:hypothetical protein